MTRDYPTTPSTELLRPNRSVTRYGGTSAQFTRMVALCPISVSVRQPTRHSTMSPPTSQSCGNRPTQSHGRPITCFNTFRVSGLEFIPGQLAPINLPPAHPATGRPILVYLSGLSMALQPSPWVHALCMEASLLSARLSMLLGEFERVPD